MKMSQPRKGMRVRLNDVVRKRWTLPDGRMLIPRLAGTLTSGRVLASQPPYVEGLFVRVLWDGLRSVEKWDLLDLEIIDAHARPASPETTSE